MRIVIGIPARMGSTRFPGKPLTDIHGLSMVGHCYKRCALSELASDIFVAACDDQVKEEVESFGGKVIMTDPAITRPGLRVAEAAETLGLHDEDIVVVVQGDEPLVHPQMIDMAITPLIEEDEILISNLCAASTSADMADPGEIKVVCDNNMNALYMSRSPIPSAEHEEVKAQWLKQVCIMPFRWHFMRKFNHDLSPTSLELQESIEMLRAIQHGYKVRMVLSPFKNKSVDTIEDRNIVREMMLEDPIFGQY